MHSFADNTRDDAQSPVSGRGVSVSVALTGFVSYHPVAANGFLEWPNEAFVALMGQYDFF